MKLSKTLLPFLLSLLVVGVVYAQTVQYTSTSSANYARACRFPNAPTQITTSGTSQQTGTLKKNTVYRVLCTSETYFAQGSNPTAATTSARIMTGSELWVLSLGDLLAFRQVAATGTCEVTECQ